MGFNWKSYIFGFGSGMVLSCVVFFIAFNIVTERQLREQAVKPGESSDVQMPGMTDEQIINKAKTLGMLFEDEYLASQNNRVATTTEQAVQVQAVPREEAGGTGGEVEDAEAEPVSGEDVTYKDIVIPDGSVCIEIARLLEDNGIVDSAEGLNAYIVNNNMQKRLTKGSVRLPVGGEYELIVNILTGKVRLR